MVGLSLRARFDLVVNLFAAKAYFDKALSIFGGWQWRPQVHVRDVADAVLAASKAPDDALRERVFNIVATNFRIRDLGEQIAALFDDVAVQLQLGEQDSRNYRVSGTRARRYLRFVPRRSIKAGVLDLKHAFEARQLLDYNNPRYSNVAWYRGDGHG